MMDLKLMLLLLVFRDVFLIVQKLIQNGHAKEEILLQGLLALQYAGTGLSFLLNNVMLDKNKAAY